MFHFFVWDCQCSHTWSIMFFLINTSFAHAAAVHPNGMKTFLSDGVSTFLINVKPTLINGPKALARNPSFWFINSSAVPFNWIYPFSKDLITFIITFVSVFISVILERNIFEISSLALSTPLLEAT